MNLRCSFFFLTALLLSTAIHAQTSCDLQSKIVAEGANITADYIKSQIAGRPFYKSEEVDKAREQVKSCSQQIGKEQEIIKNKLELKREKANVLLKYSGVITIQKDIEEWEKKLKESGAALEKRLQEKTTGGLFVVLITNVEEFNKPKLQKAAQAAIAQRAVKDLVGEHINKTQQLTNQGELQEIIKSYTSGQPEPIGAALTEYSNLVDGYFLYLAQVEVKPLKRSADATSVMTMSSSFVYNLELDGNYEAQLQAKGVTREHLDQMRSLIQTQLPLVRESNKTALQLLITEIAKAEKDINIYREKISQRKQDKANSSDEIKKICDELGISFLPLDPDKSALDAKNRIKRDIADLEAQQIDSKDREIIPLLKVIEGTYQTNLPKELAQVIYDGSKNFEGQASSAFEVEELVEVQNGIGERILESNKIKYIRRLRKIWAFPIAGTNDDFKVVLFGQFKSEKGGKTKLPEPPKLDEPRTKVEEPDKTDNKPVQPKTRTITGSVKDERTLKPLVGAIVSLDATSFKTTTDVDGRFRLTVPSDITAQLRISYTGFKDFVIPSLNNPNVYAVLTPKRRTPEKEGLVEVGTSISWLSVRNESDPKIETSGASMGIRFGARLYIPISSSISLMAGSVLSFRQGGRIKSTYNELEIWQNSNVQTLLNQPLPNFGKLHYRPAYAEIPLGIRVLTGEDGNFAIEASFDLAITMLGNGNVYNTPGQNTDKNNIEQELTDLTSFIGIGLRRIFISDWAIGLSTQIGMGNISSQESYITDQGVTKFGLYPRNLCFTLSRKL